MLEWISQNIPLVTSGAALITAIFALISSIAAWSNANATKRLAKSAEDSEKLIQRQARALEESAEAIREYAETSKQYADNITIIAGIEKEKLKLRYEEVDERKEQDLIDKVPFVTVTLSSDTNVSETVEIGPFLRIGNIDHDPNFQIVITSYVINGFDMSEQVKGLVISRTSQDQKGKGAGILFNPEKINDVENSIRENDETEIEVMYEYLGFNKIYRRRFHFKKQESGALEPTAFLFDNPVEVRPTIL